MPSLPLPVRRYARISMDRGPFSASRDTNTFWVQHLMYEICCLRVLLHSFTSESMAGGSLTCSCGRAFVQHNALSNHQRRCQKSRNRLSGALSKFKDLLDNRKRRRIDPDDDIPPPVSTIPLVDNQLGHLGLRMASVIS